MTINAIPLTFTTSGGGSYCSGGAGVTVSLSGSQSGVNYQLQVNGTNAGSLVAGTGSALNFTGQTAAGTYTVIATSATGSCNSTMNGSATVTINSTPSNFTTSGGGSYCSGGAGVTVSLSGSESGVNYQLQLNGSNSGSAVAGTGSALSFTGQTAAGTYTVIATNATTGCTANMSGSATVIVNSLPTVTFTSSPTSNSCSGTAITYTTQSAQSNYAWNLSGTLNTDYTIASGSLSTSSNTVSIIWLTSGTKTVSVNYANGNGCTATSPTTSTTDIALNTAWTGSAGDNLWNTSGNWSCGVPDASDNVSIPGTATITVNGTAATVNKLSLISGASINLGTAGITVGDSLILNGSSNISVGSNTLTLSGAIDGIGTLSGNGSSNLNLGSGASGTLYFHATNNGFNNFTANASCSLGSALNLRGVLKMNSGTLTTGGFLTMESAATHQAMVDFSGSGSVSGNVKAQRYMSGINNAWRGFSAPVTATYSDISPTVNVGVRGQNGSNLITLRDMPFWTGINWQTASNWRIAADTNINATLGGTITAGRGFLAYAGTSGIADLTSPVTLDLTGSLNSSVITAPGLVSSDKPYNGWMLMGNPYLATLDWESMYGTADVANLNATIYMYNTTSGTWNSYNSVTNASTGNGSNLIAPFQVFLVKASNATVPTLNFRTSQTSTSASIYNFRHQSNLPIVRLNVSKNNVQVQTALTLVAAQATSGLDADYDAQYPGSFNGHDFYSMTIGDYKLQQNSRPMPAAGISEPYYFEYNGTGNYSIASVLENIDPMWNVYLEDKITNTMHNLRTSAYNFTHQATNRKDRFVLHLNALSTSVNEVSNNYGPILSMENGSLNVRFGGEAASRKLEVVDLSGKVLRTVVMENATATTIEMSDLAQAVYLLRATGNGTTSVTKFVNVR